MKRFLSVLLILCLVFCLCSCGGKTAEEEDSEFAEIVNNLFGMQPIYCAYSILSDNYDAADPSEDDLYFWKLMYYVTLCYGTSNEDVIFDLTGIQLPTAEAEEYGRAICADFESLPKLPEGVAITYDSTLDSYILPWSESMVTTQILGVNYSKENPKNFVVATQLFDMSQVTSDATASEEMIPGVCMRFELEDDKDAAEDSIFKFRVVSAEVIDISEVYEN